MNVASTSSTSNARGNGQDRAPVAIVGAGPVGLALALGLARQGVRSSLFERKDKTSERSKAPAIHVRTREIFRQWGVEEDFVEAGVLRRKITLHNPAPSGRPLLTIDFSELEEEADRPGLLVLEQGETERLLLAAVRASGMCDVRFGSDVVGLTQSEEGVTLTVREAAAERSPTAAFAVGCDGASSFVRNALGLPFPGLTYATRPMLADIDIGDDRDALPWPRTLNGKDGVTTALRLHPGRWRIIRLEAGEPGKTEEVPTEEVRERAAEVLGEGPFEVVWASRFRIHLRASPKFRIGRVLLAGDAAHVHSPAGGLGMNGGIQDAHNLAWKLALALRGGDAERLLDSYDVERRAVVVENVSRFADLNTRLFLQAPALVRKGAMAAMRSLLAIKPFRRRMLRRTAMIDLDYPPSPLLDHKERSAGVRLPNLRLGAPDGSSVRLHDLLSNEATVLVLGEGGEVAGDIPLSKVVRIGSGGHDDPRGSLGRLLGGRRGWILVRPDTHVAWAKTNVSGVDEAVRRALGLPPEQAWL